MSSANQKLKEYTGVWVYCELHKGKFIQADYELVSQARRLADDLKEKVYCLLVGDSFYDPLQTLGGYGADEVFAYHNPEFAHYTTEPYADVVCTAIETYKPRILLFPATSQGRDLAPRCAARVHTGLTADCVRLDVDIKKYAAYLSRESNLRISEAEIEADDKELKMTRLAFGNHLMATITCSRFRPCMSTVRPGVMECGAYRDDWARSCQVQLVDYDLSNMKIREQVVAWVDTVKEEVSLEKAQCIVSIGRGIAKDAQKGKTLAERLAKLLGAELGGSRAAVDEGWLTEDRQIGQTGKTVRPRLYVALGISGAMQHLVGMQKSGSILAINRDPRAPIFEVADYGIVGDLYRVLPILIDELEKAEKNGKGRETQ